MCAYSRAHVRNMCRTAFEVTGADTIEVLAPNAPTETITADAYRCYTSYGSKKDYDFIPHRYFELMEKSPVIDEIPPESTPIPSACPELYPFQLEAVSRMATLGRCINASEVGTGKTLQALSALRHYADPEKGDLVLAPGYLVKTWVAEIAKWLPEMDYTVIGAKSKSRPLNDVLNTLLYGPGVKILSYDRAANLFANIANGNRAGAVFFNTVICDESHFLKDHKSKRYANIKGAISTARQMFLLSGTPAPNRPKELFSQFALLYPKVFDNYYTFTDRYCAGKKDRFGRYDDRGSSCVRELAYLTSKLVLRIRSADHLADIPNVTRERVSITPADVPKKFLAQMKSFREELAKMDESRSAMLKAQALASAMFRETAVVKIDPVIEYLRTYSETTTERTIVFCKHMTMFDSICGLMDELGFRHIAISGATPTAKRQELIDDFKSDDTYRFAVLTIGAASTGFTVCPVARMIFAELSWSPSDLAQAEGRINRLNGAKNLLYLYLICKGTLDETVFSKLERKTALTNALVDQSKDYGDFEFSRNKKRKLEN